jgi:ankyrin repeat protein
MLHDVCTAVADKTWQAISIQALHKAAAAGDADTVELLVNAGIAVDVVGKDKGTALHKACQTGNVETVQRLLHLGAEVGCCSSDGRCALHHVALAAAANSTAIAQILLDAGASIDAKDKNGDTALQIAERANNAALVKMLLNSGAGPFPKNHRGMMPPEKKVDPREGEWSQRLPREVASGTSVAEAAGPSVPHFASATVSMASWPPLL